MTVHKPLITFQRVPVRPRRDVWTAERQVAFIRKLANCGGVPPRPHLAMGREPAARNRLPRARAWDRELCELSPPARRAARALRRPCEARDAGTVWVKGEWS